MNLTITKRSICPSCGLAFPALCYGGDRGRMQMFCGLRGCYADGIRAYWRALGYVARVEYVEGAPLLVGVPVKA